MSEIKNGLQDSASAFCFHDFLHEVFNIPLAIIVFGRIGYIICFHEDLIIYAVNIVKGVMMPNQKGDPFDLLFRHSGIRQKVPDQNLAFLLLMLPVCISVFFTAKRTGNVVCNGGDFQYKLRLRIETFQFADCL